MNSVRRSTPLLLFLLLACSPREPAPGDASVPLPTGEPYIRGTVTHVEAERIRVEANPRERSGSPKAVLRVSERTPVLYRSGRVADPGALSLGQQVSVWVGGPVMESYPVQATADTVVIERSDR